MGSIVVRGLDDDVKQKFREIAAAEGSSMEALLRKMIEERVTRRHKGETHNEEVVSSADIGDTPWVLELREAALRCGGVDLPIPPRQPARPPIDFSG